MQPNKIQIHEITDTDEYLQMSEWNLPWNERLILNISQSKKYLRETKVTVSKITTELMK